jgi:hypothetical protein
VLAGGTLDAGAADDQAVFLGTVDGLAALFEILFDVTEGSLVLQTGYRAGLKDVFLSNNSSV